MSLLYNMFLPSKVKNDFGVAYPNPFSYNLNDFAPEKVITSYALTQGDIDRFDLFIYEIYGSSLYEKITIMLNSIVDIHDLPIGHIINLWESSDLDTFILSQTQVAV